MERLGLTLDIRFHHLLDQALEVDMPPPSQLGLGLCAISPKQLDFGRSEVPALAIHTSATSRSSVLIESRLPNKRLTSHRFGRPPCQSWCPWLPRPHPLPPTAA